jgi:cell wall-associated NlpC family hydrolase
MHTALAPTTDRSRRSHGVLAWIVSAGLVVLAGCSSAPMAPMDPSPAAPPRPAAAPAEVPARISLDQAHEVTLHAISLVGTPYRWGGNTPETGFDCSGLIAYVYKAQAAIVAPRTVAALALWGNPVPAAQLRTGDLVVFTQKGVTNHAGIYVGEGRFVHAPSSGGTVRLDRLTSAYWSKQQVGFRRP